MLGIGLAYNGLVSSDSLNHQSQTYNFQTGYSDLNAQPATVGQLPLTPPGSPIEDGRLRICEGLSNTPPKSVVRQIIESTASTNSSHKNAADMNVSGYAHGQFSHLRQSVKIDADYNGLSTSNYLASNWPLGADTTPFSYAVQQQLAAAGDFLDNTVFTRALSSVSVSPNSVSGTMNGRCTRTEKKPIPDIQKDEKYFERRRKNNAAAKKSRDTRKYREDEIATRAAFLEKENAILRAQLVTLREEANSLRAMLIQKSQRHMQAQMQLQGSSTSIAMA